MNKLEELHKLRERAGIKFTKSFNYIEAERNIHLADKDKFFKKFMEKLTKMGYSASNDFDFDVIRHKYRYAERHHIGSTYEWAYFYSTTFEIGEDLINYLTRHNFIFKKEKEKTIYEKIAEKSKKNIKDYDKAIEKFQKAITLNENKITAFTKIIDDKLTKKEEAKENYQKAIENCKKKIENCLEQIDKLEKTKKEKMEND